MKPDRHSLYAWTITALLLAASLGGAWLLAGGSAAELVALIEQLETRAHARPGITAVYVAAIIAVTTATTLPTATLLCLVSGYLFGTFTGTLVALAGMLAGASITFLTVRFAVRERMRSWMSRGRRKRLLDLIERDSFYYLVAFRIIPVAPYFAINAAGAMIRITLKRFLTATTLGLVPIILVYTSVGAGVETLV
ncbi:MAG: TVP38/TMEM64 family protein, partial [Wenzhouxiangellaceae bacterium]